VLSIVPGRREPFRTIGHVMQVRFSAKKGCIEAVRSYYIRVLHVLGTHMQVKRAGRAGAVPRGVNSDGNMATSEAMAWCWCSRHRD
jgi:hypothetical protein